MAKKILSGNEAVATAAIESGMNLATGYPGTPSTEIIETVFKYSEPQTHVEWSINEKVALEISAGAAISGAWTLTTMKQVGLNVAADPLMGINYLGIQGSMVIVITDDPGPHASQTEQDTRMFCKYANLLVFDPSSPSEAYFMTKEAFRLSNENNMPVIIRMTTRICHSSEDIEVEGNIKKVVPNGFNKDPKWIIFPRLSYENHVKLEKKQVQLSDKLSNSKYNYIFSGGSLGIVTGGIASKYVEEIRDKYYRDLSVMKIGTPNPFPQKLAEEFLQQVENVLVIEELDPVIEEGLLEIAYKHKGVRIIGKKTGHVAYAGELDISTVKEIIERFIQQENRRYMKSYPLFNFEELKMNITKSEISITMDEISTSSPVLPKRQPTLCAGCPHRASFYIVKESTKDKKAIYNGDIGCYTLGNAKPLNAIDTCLCMGAGITMAQGIHHIVRDTKNIAFVGDSTFFHTGIPGIINAAYNDIDMTVVILDNKTTAMTGHQYHPGLDAFVKGKQKKGLDIYEISKACGVEFIEKLDPYNLSDSISIVKKAVDYKGLSMIIFERPCVSGKKSSKQYTIDEVECKKCMKCIDKLGCPAMYQEDYPVIDKELCYGCGICAEVCQFDAIKEGKSS